MDYRFKPLEKLGEDNLNNRALEWWQAYNAVKHNLHNLDKANFKNVIHATGAAGILVSDYTTRVGAVEGSKLFRDIYFSTY